MIVICVIANRDFFVDETQNVPHIWAVVTHVMLYRDAVSVRAVHHVHVHRDIQEHAQKTITAHAIERAVYHVCTPADWIRRRVGTVLPVVTVGWTATTNRTIRLLMLRVRNTMAARVRPIQNVHFITTVPPRVHLAIPMAERCLMDANTVMAMRAIKHVLRINLVVTHIPPVVMHITPAVVHIPAHVPRTVIPAVIPVAKARPRKPKAACHAAKDAVHRVRRRVLKLAARDAVPVAAKRAVSVAVYTKHAQQDIHVHIMPLHAAEQKQAQNTVHNMAPVMEHVTVPSMAHNMEHTLAVVQNT